MNLQYRFGRFELCPETRQLFEHGTPLSVGGRAFDLLVALVERHGRTVSREELYEIVWPGLAVEPNNLHVQVWALRGRLGRDAIVTVARRGYRFTPDVEIAGARPRGPAHDACFDVLPEAAREAVGAGQATELVSAQLRGHRLVTLVGEDDAALAHTAEAAAREWRPLLAGGVWHVDPVTLARALPVDARASPPGPGSVPLPDGLGRLIVRLAARDALLVITGCHRAAEPVRAAIRATLARAPAVRVLASSRTPIAIAGERVLRLPPRHS